MRKVHFSPIYFSEKTFCILDIKENAEGFFKKNDGTSLDIDGKMQKVFSEKSVWIWMGIKCTFCILDID